MTVKEGCPIVTCSRCRGVFLDKDIKEPAFQKTHLKINVFKMFIAPLYPFGVAGIFFSILAIVYKTFGAMVFAIPAFALYAYIVYVGIKKRKDIERETTNEYEESRKRLSDKEYVILLINLGYHVPKSFLRENYPDLMK